MEIQEPDQHTEQLLIIKAHRSYRAKHSKRKKIGCLTRMRFLRYINHRNREEVLCQ